MTASAQGIAKLVRETHPNQHIPIMQAVMPSGSLLMHHLIYEPGLLQELIGLTIIALHSKSNESAQPPLGKTDATPNSKPTHQNPTQNRIHTPQEKHSSSQNAYTPNSQVKSISKPYNPYNKPFTSFPATTPDPSPSGMTIYMYGENKHMTNECTIQTLTVKQDNLYNDKPMSTPAAIMKNVMKELFVISAQTRHIAYIRPNNDNPHATELAILPQFPPDKDIERDYISNLTTYDRQTTFNIKIRASFLYTMIKIPVQTIGHQA